MQVTSRSFLLAIATLTAWFAQLPARAAGDTVVTGELTVDRSTSISLFFEWAIAGDANRNAAVAVSFRKKGSSEWHVGPQMVRMMPGKLDQGSAAKGSLTSEKFVGGIPNLEPDKEYGCRFVMYDPDGVEGASSQAADARTLTAPLSDKR